jgi:anthranilate synthase/aminodeoxychorismate synthase-like glutamine amidotransferase
MKAAQPQGVEPIVDHPPDAPDVLLLDNRDSFTWNIAQGFQELGASVQVVDTDAIDAPAIVASHPRPRLVCLGPGPRGPAELPHLLDVVRACAGHVPLLGVCLGMQAIALAFGGSVSRAKAPVHGKRDAITHAGEGVLRDLPSPLWVMRYHSLVVSVMPAQFAISARDGAGQAMALRHRDPAVRIEAVQFHPESIGTAGGLHILENALVFAGVTPRHLAKERARKGAIPDDHAIGPGHPEARYSPRSSSSEVSS